MAEAEAKLNNLESFLKECKERVKEPEFLVFGNQAADMDSIMSAFTLAYFVSQPAISSFLGQDIGFSIPVINIARDDMKLRKDSLLILEKVGISADLLIFQDDITIADQTQLILVDHNTAEYPFNEYDPKVSVIVDHHKDDGYSKNCQGGKRIIEKAGSCLSLVAREILKIQTNFYEVNPSLALMVIATILLDTGNFSEEVNKTTSLDLELYKKLSPLVDCPSYDVLLDSRIDVAGFTIGDLFRKDMKIRKYGDHVLAVATIPEAHEKFVNESFEKEVNAFMKTRGVDPFCIMTTHTLNGHFGRELSLFSHNQGSFTQLSKGLEASELKLSKLKSMVDTNWSRFWIQGNAALSRKKVMPLLRKLLETIGKL